MTQDLQLRNFRVLDCKRTGTSNQINDGDLRFQVWAEANDPMAGDTWAASLYLCSTDNADNARLIARALELAASAQR
jgi:hypothetical protein